MNKLLKIASAFAIAACLCSCHKEVLIPDPGFDMKETVLDTVRRDTTTTYSISFPVKAPNGVKSIELLNGRNFEVIRDFPEYVGKDYFDFSHVFDLSACDEEKDSLFIYNIKIRTNDNRAYNKSIRVQHLRKSHPEIVGPASTTMNIFGRAFVFDGNVSGGYYALEQIKADLNGETVCDLGASDLNGATSYHLFQKVTKDFEDGKSYKFNVYVKASNEEKTYTYNLVKAPLKKPVAMKQIYNGSYTVVEFHYNEKGLLEWLYEPAGGHYVTMQYDDEGRVVVQFRTTNATIGQGGYDSYGTYNGNGGYANYFEYNDDGSLYRNVLFGYYSLPKNLADSKIQDDSKVHKLLDPWWKEALKALPLSGDFNDVAGTELEGYVYRITTASDPTFNVYKTVGGRRYTVQMTDTKTTVLPYNDGELGLIADYEEGNMLYTDLLGSSSTGVYAFWGRVKTDWAVIDSYTTVLNPMYIKDYPLAFQVPYSGYPFQQVIGCKYAVGSVHNAYTYGTYEDVYTIPYTLREDGLLKSWADITSGAYSWTKEYVYYYDDEPDTWRADLTANEANYQWFK